MARPLVLANDSPVAAAHPPAPALPPSTAGPATGGPSKRPVHASSTSAKRAKSRPADPSTHHAVAYTTAVTAGAEALVPPFDDVGWGHIPTGYFGSSFAVPLPHAPFVATAYDPHFAPQRSSMYSEPFAPAPAPSLNPELVKGLPALNAFSTQVLAALGLPVFQDTIDLVNKIDTQPGREYALLKEQFEVLFGRYSQGRPFVDARALHLDGQQHLPAVRKANLAAFVSSIFGGQQVSLSELNDHFLDIFVPPEGRFLSWHGGLFVELKTQAYIKALMKGDERDVAMDRLFPKNTAEQMLARHQDVNELSPAEADFVTLVLQRRQSLFSKGNGVEAGVLLAREYGWSDFLREVNSCIHKNLDGSSSTSRQGSQSSMYSNAGPPTLSPGGFYHQQLPEAIGGNYDDTITRAALMAHAALHGQRSTGNLDAPSNMSFHQAYVQPAAQQQQQQSLPASKAPNPSNPLAVQSAPTQVLYDQARSASSVRAQSSARKPGATNQRRPWSLEEERALLDGLDRVKGPHWSQILALYGDGGTISELLKTRNQVQLKDKARNIKLLFLKSCVEVPVHLQSVTGDLKTRAPAQAAKQEALARQRREAQENQMRGHREQMNAAAVLAAGRWPGPLEAFSQTAYAAPQMHPTIDPSLHATDNETADTHGS